MSKHTPGPWRLGYWSGRCHKPQHAGNHPGPRGNDPCEYEYEFVARDDCGIAGPELGQMVVNSMEELEISADDARLIAAAPDLLRELRHLVRLLEPMEQAGTLNVPGLATLNGARAALAKAEPQPPYPEFCRHPDQCAGKGYCPRDPTCAD